MSLINSLPPCLMSVRLRVIMLTLAIQSHIVLRRRLQWNPGLQTPAYSKQFCLSQQKSHIFFLKVTTNKYGQWTFNFLCPVSQTSICHLNILSMKNLIETGNDLSKGLSNIQSTCLSCKLNQQHQYEKKNRFYCPVSRTLKTRGNFRPRLL